MVLFCQLLKACSVWEDLGDMTTDREYGRPIQRHFLSSLQYCPAKHNQRQLGCSKCRKGTS